MTAAQRAKRNAQVRSSRAGGASWAAVAAEFGISQRHAKRIVADAGLFTERVSVLVDEPDLARKMAFDAHVTAVQTLTTWCGSRNGSVAVGAARSLPGAVMSLLGLMRATGLTPTTARGWMFLGDVPALMEALGQACDDAGVSREDVATYVVRAFHEQHAHQLAERAEEALTA